MRHSLTCLLSLCFFTLSAQGYRAIPSTGAKFRIEYSYYDTGFPPCYTLSVFHQYTDGDTLIDSLPVTRISTGTLAVCGSSGAGCGPAFPMYSAGYLHQDTVAGKLYFKVAGKAPELLFDFGANVGDTITYPEELDIYMYDPVLVVDSTDTVTLADGIARRRLFLHSVSGGFSAENPVWVEGIGDLYHGFIPHTYFEDSWIATCYQENSVDLDNGSFFAMCLAGGDCDMLTATAAPRPEIAISISPNPSHSLHLQGIADRGTVTIYSPDARMIFDATVGSDGIVNGSEVLPAGLYLVTLRLTSGEELRARWMKTE